MALKTRSNRFQLQLLPELISEETPFLKLKFTFAMVTVVQLSSQEFSFCIKAALAMLELEVLMESEMASFDEKTNP